MLNNENDKIVTAEANRRFFNGLRTAKKYVSLNQDGKMPHGSVTFREPERIADLITKFSFENLPESTIGKIYAYRAYEQVNRLSSGPCYDSDSFDECLKKAKERVDQAHAALENLRPAFLRFIKDEAEFAKFNEVLAANHQAWIRITERASSLGLKSGSEFYQWVKANPDEETPRAIEGEKYIYSVLKRIEEAI
jgi:hypothetical protein